VFTIGDFSKITGLTVKTLRFYHEQSLLTPSHVDEESGYRYYDHSKIEAARIVAHLRSLDLSLDEIRAILAYAGDDADLRDVMERQKATLEDKIKRYREIVRSINEFLARDDEVKKIMAATSFEVAEKVADSLLVAGIRLRGRYADCGPAFARIGRALGRRICGKPLLLHYDSEYREADADFESCMPVRAGKPVAGISVRELPGGRCVALLHRGPYDDLGRSYAKILDYVRSRGYDVVLPTREIYHKGPGMIFRGNPKSYLTEIQMLIKPGEPAERVAPAAPRAGHRT
jgi:DNA-binding transcriptional MerR regulator/effector-binding domain-containing protein